jgi:glycosyltransferase involved in cell wall biosynthesis
MDAGSKDDTIDILKSYNGRLRYHSAPDRGQADAVNKGFAISRGKVFTFLNADDTYLPGAVGAAVRHMMRNPAVGVIYGEANYVKEDGSVIGRYPTLPFDAQTLNRCCYICQPASFMWSDVFQTVGCMNPDLQFALDYDLWIRIAKLYPMLKVDDLMATSRMYRENKTLGKRRPVYMEILGTVKAHYGYVPFDWVFGYSSFLVDRKDQFFEISHPSFSKVGLSLVLGTYYNRQQAKRYWREWCMHLGVGAAYEGRYGDNWISKRYVTDVHIPEGCRELIVTGRHLAPFKEGLAFTLELNGSVRRTVTVDRHGPFNVAVECPKAVEGGRAKLTIEAAQTFRPAANGDYRKLSCIIDSIHPAGGAQA